MRLALGITILALHLGAGPATAQDQWFQPKIESFDDGLQMLVDESSSGAGSIRIIVFGGAVHEAPQQRGIANITANVLINPVATSSASNAIHDLNNRLDRIGAQLSVRTGLNSTIFSLDAPEKSIIEAFELLLSNLSSPSISISRIQSEAKVRNRSIFAAAGDDLNDSLSSMLYQFQGENLLDPSRTSTQSITKEGILSFYRKYYRPDRIVVVATGGMTTSNIRAAIRSRFLLPMPDDKDVFITTTSTSVLAKPILPLKTTGLATPRQMIRGFDGCETFDDNTTNCIVLGEILRQKVEEKLQNSFETNVTVSGGYVMLPRDGFFALRIESGKWKGLMKEVDDIALSLSRRIQSRDVEQTIKYFTSKFAWERVHPRQLADRYVGLTLTGRRDAVDFESMENGIRSVDVQSLRRAAQKFFKEERAFLIKLTPVMQ